MKAKLIRELVGRDPEDKKVKLLVRFPQRPEKNRKGQWIWPVGTVTAHPFSFRLVQMGVAIPADDACKQACYRSDEQMTQAQFAYERLAAGIHPEDYDRYDRGEILGYNPDGSDIPGPNAITFDDEEELEEEEDDNEEEDEE